MGHIIGIGNGCDGARLSMNIVRKCYYSEVRDILQALANLTNAEKEDRKLLQIKLIQIMDKQNEKTT